VWLGPEDGPACTVEHGVESVMKVISPNLPFLNRSLAYKPLLLSGLVRISTEGNAPYSGVGGASTRAGAPLGWGEDPT
jgi:hypothetical protein